VLPRESPSQRTPSLSRDGRDQAHSAQPVAGAGDGWNARLPLQHWPEDAIEIDAEALRFAVPTFLLRLRTFIDWHRAHGREVVVLTPRKSGVRSYLARMRMDRGLAAGVFQGLPHVTEHDRREALIPVTRMHQPPDVDELTADLSHLLFAQLPDMAVLADAIHMAVSELCGNAVEHGQNPHGCYVAAQRYERPKPRTVLAIGDLGIGLPDHVRQRNPSLTPDERAIEEATKAGVSGAPDAGTHRGYGFHWVFEEARNTALRYAQLEIRSGRGQYVARLNAGGELSGHSTVARHKRGTWITFELGS
jgi:hypothetical protein